MSKQLFKRPKKKQCLILLVILGWVFALNVAAHKLGIESWPMFLVTILFSLMGGKKENIPSIFLGGTVGLFLSLLFHYFTISYGVFYLSLGIILAAIILGGMFCPILLNNVAFAYLTISCIKFDELNLHNVFHSTLVLWIGGGVALAGILLIETVMDHALTEKQ